jgi:hypothetical protein
LETRCRESSVARSPARHAPRSAHPVEGAEYRRAPNLSLRLGKTDPRDSYANLTTPVRRLVHYSACRARSPSAIAKRSPGPSPDAGARRADASPGRLPRRLLGERAPARRSRPQGAHALGVVADGRARARARRSPRGVRGARWRRRPRRRRDHASSREVRSLSSPPVPRRSPQRASTRRRRARHGLGSA